MSSPPTLEGQVAALVHAVAQDAPRTWREVRIWFDRGRAVDPLSGRSRVMRSDLMTVAEAAGRFARIIATHPSWVNLSVIGLIDGDALLISIEAPDGRQTSNVPTSCNYSGPPTAVRDAGWEARAVITLEDA
jgi:hypothetical protein